MTSPRRAYLREYQRKWKNERRQAWLRENGPCKRCGSWDDLQVDHIDPSTKVEHKVWSWSTKRRTEELAKCQVLCESCHLKKTLADVPPTQHGRGWMYIAYKCRCEKCREWKRNDSIAYRARHGLTSNGHR